MANILSVTLGARLITRVTLAGIVIWRPISSVTVRVETASEGDSCGAADESAFSAAGRLQAVVESKIKAANRNQAILVFFVFTKYKSPV